MTQWSGHIKHSSPQWIHSSSFISHTQIHTFKYYLDVCISYSSALWLPSYADDEEWRHLWVIHTHHDVGRQLGWTTENAENMNNKGKTFSAIFYACLCGFSGNMWCGCCFWLLLFVYFFYIINAPFGSPVSKTRYCRIYRIIYVLIIIIIVTFV